MQNKTVAYTKSQTLCTIIVYHAIMKFEGNCFCWCCDRKDKAASARSFTLWQQPTIEISPRVHSSCTLFVVFNR